MSEAVVDSFQPVHVKEQQGKLPAGALTSLDLQIEHIHEMAIVGQPRQRIARCLRAQMLLQFSLPGNILGDNLIGFQLALLAENFSSAQPHFQGGKVLPLPIYFDGIGLSIGNGSAKQLRSPSRVLKNLAGEAKRQEFLSRLIAEHPYHRVVDFQKSAVETAAANSVA